MPTNDFLPFGTAVGANVMTQADYLALTARSNGFSAGTAASAQLNKAWRQSSIIASMLAQFIADQSGQNAIDDGTTATLEANLLIAIRAAGRQTTVLTDTGTANTYAAANAPALAALPTTSGYLQRVNIANANTGAATYAPDGLAPKPIYGLALQPLQGGELPVGIAVMMYLVQTGVNGGNGAWIIIESLGGAQQIQAATRSLHAVNAVQIQAQALTAFTTGGASGALTLTPTPAITAYAANQRFRVKFGLASTGADTLNVSALGAKSIKQYDSTGAKVAAVFAANQLADVEYDGTDAVLLDQLPVNYLADPWALQPLGVPIGMFFDTAGEIPPTNNSAYRYIKLTSGDAYNDGVLTSESVSGAAPLILASAVISLAGSPFNGLTVQLINTERRALRAGAARTIEQDQIQNITGSVTDSATALSATTSATGAFQSLATLSTRASPQTATGYSWNFDASRVARAGTETRSKNVGVTYFMRIK